MDDDELLAHVRQERRRSIGFGEVDSGELTVSRERALQYVKGDMPDLPTLEGRSSAVDTTIADAIETVLPDVLEVFIGGDDVATFVPTGERDEQAAQDETDYVNHVVFVENPGFLNLYTVFKDALITRTGIFHFWWEDYETQEVRHVVRPDDAISPDLMQTLSEAVNGQPLEQEEKDDGSVSLNATVKRGRVCIAPLSSEDFTVAFDTIRLQDATYCAMRARPRVQDLIVQGLDPEKVRNLPSYVIRNDPIVELRDEAGENQQRQDGSGGDMRVVEIRYHYIRILKGGQLVIEKVTTDGQETVLLDREEVSQIPFAAVTPYMNPHRFYGESVADKLFEVQRIKSVLLRSGLDNIYFGLNQRMEVSEAASSDHTIADLLRNAPGVPVRSKTGEAVRPISAGPLNVDPFEALELAATMAESRTGIVRNAQGLNPDTLHETATGAVALIAAAQKRVRMIARIFAETGVKDLFLGVHAMLRSGYSDDHAPASAKIKKAWRQVRPNQWPPRDAMNIHVGVGSAGREHELMVATERLKISQGIMQAQGGLQGPLLDAKNAAAQLVAWERASGSKKADVFWSDPADPNAPQPQPKQDPEMVKVQAQTQAHQAELASKTQLAQQQQQFEQQRDAAKIQADAQAADRQFQLDQQRLQLEAQLKREAAQAQMELERWKAAETLKLQREEAAATIALKREEIRMKASTSTDVAEAAEDLPG